MRGDRNLLLDPQHFCGCTVSKMNKEQQISEMTDLPNIGKVTAERLVSAGVVSFSMLKEIGTKETYLRLFEKEGWGFGMNPCFLYAIEGAILGERWNEISIEKKEEFKQFSKDLRESFPGNSR